MFSAHFWNKSSQLSIISDNFSEKSFFLFKSIIKPFFPSLRISLDPSVSVERIGVPSFNDSMLTIPKASDLLAEILARHLEKILPTSLFGIDPIKFICLSTFNNLESFLRFFSSGPSPTIRSSIFL